MNLVQRGQGQFEVEGKAACGDDELVFRRLG
jgi:hypothetical protein